MVDYRRDTGSAGYLTIRDTGSTVEFWISCTDSYTFTYGKSWSGKVNGVNVGGSFDFNRGAGSIRVGSWTVSTGQTVTFGIGATGTSGLGGPTSFSASISRPKPTAPSGLSVSRVSDSQHTLNWTRHGTYTSVVVQRRTNGGSWQQVGVANGNAYTYTDKSTSSNKKFEYRVAGKAASGQSGWSNTATVYTTPAAPTGVKAARSGDDIRVSASAVPPYASSYDVRDGSTVVGSHVSLPFTHVAPDPAVPHTYTVRGVVGSLNGGWSAASNTVQLISPPNAPSGLSPNGAVRASDEDVLFKWAHNPVDSSDQTGFELQYRSPGGAWTTVTGTTDEQASVPLDVGSVEWQVRTKGAHPDWSPWSPIATFTVIDRPGVAILQPNDMWDASVLPVAWSWFQAQERPQSGWQLELLDSSLTAVESRNGSGSTSSFTLGKKLTEGDWTIRVRAATGDVWSPWAEETFTVVFTPPGEPVLTGVWDEEQGGVQLQVAAETFGVAVLDDGVWYAEFGE